MGMQDDIRAVMREAIKIGAIWMPEGVEQDAFITAYVDREMVMARGFTGSGDDPEFTVFQRILAELRRARDAERQRRMYEIGERIADRQRRDGVRLVRNLVLGVLALPIGILILAALVPC